MYVKQHMRQNAPRVPFENPRLYERAYLLQ